MQLRRFTADSTPAALGAVRMALGDDAIILANRRLGNQVEIIATGQMDDGFDLAEVSFDNFTSDQSTQDIHSTDRSGGSIESRNLRANTSLSEKIADDKVVLSGASNRAEVPAAVDSRAQTNITSPSNEQKSAKLYAVDFSAATPQTVNSSSERAEAKNSAETVPLGRDADVASTIKAALAEQSELFKTYLENIVANEREHTRKALENQENLINTHFKGLDVKLWGNTAPNRTAHLQGLFALGIGAELAIQLVERADPEATVEDALRHSFALLKTTLPIAADKTFSVPGVTIMSGPPGSGKTTAVVKMATQHVQSFGRDSIVIICADTRRIGAFEELQAYGRLLGVPTVHAHDKYELGSLLDAFTHKQLVLVDHTLPVAEGTVELPENILEPRHSDSVRHLFTLSANTQSASVDALLAKHCHGRKMQCILTQLDTSARLGELFNPLIRYHVPIAYWSDSASVQAPLQKADASILIATAAAMSRRIPQSSDDQWLSRLIQPTDRMMEEPLAGNTYSEVSVL